MNIRVFIIDDEPIALEKLRNYVAKIPFLTLAGEADNPIDAASLIEETQPDVIYTDINMPDMDGLSFIRSLPVKPLVVFTTAHSQYAAESYRVPTVDYLLKPYNFTDFQRSVLKVQAALAAMSARNAATTPENKQHSVFIKTDYRYLRVNLNDITYIKGYGEYLQIYLVSSPTPIITLSSFATMLEKLSSNFIQIHRSYIVNMDRVMRIEKMRVVMDENTSLPVSDSYKSTFSDYLAMHSIGQSRKG